MSTQIQLRRGTTAQHATFTGAVGEITIDTDKDVSVVHDGVTAGGFPSATEASVTNHITDATAAHAASAIGNTPAGNIAATDVQTALNELDTEKAKVGSITANGNTMNTAKLLGRTTASSGAIEEITIGSGLSFSAGTLTTSGFALSGANADIVTMTALTGITGDPTITGTLKVSTGAAVGGATAGTGGLAFPATAVAVADANTLDDYEEGVWTPVATFSGGDGNLSNNTQIGTYIKIGKCVLCQMYLAFNETTASGNLSITGLPFAANASANQVNRFAFSYDNMATLSGAGVGDTQPSGTTISCYQGATGTLGTVSATNTANSSVSSNFHYFI